MAARAHALALAALAALALGAGGAAGHQAATSTTVRVQVIGRGVVTDDKSQMNCGNGGTVCRVSYTGTGSVVFSEAPAPGWTFSDWDGCSGATCEVAFDLDDDDHEVIATFDQAPPPGEKTLTVRANGTAEGDGGNISGEDIDCDTGDQDCSTDVTDGSTLTIVETPDEGFVFAGWSGACSGSSRSCTLPMDDNRTATGTFRKPRLSVSVNGNGTVTGDGITCTGGSGDGCTADVDADKEVVLTATPGAGGSFTSWSGCTGTNGTTCTVSMTGDRSVTANFSGGTTTGPATFPLSVSVTGSGTVTGAGLDCGEGGTTCSTTVAAGTNVTLTAGPSTGETFQGWSGACTGTARTCSLTMSAARSVSAAFSGGSSAQVELAVTVTGRGTVTGGGIDCGNGKTVCTAREREGSTVGLTATAAAGARFVGWGGACTGTSPSCTVEMDDAERVTATFAGGSGGPSTAGSPLRSLGRPVVARAPGGFRVTLRFRTSEPGRARVQALRAGRVQTALAFAAAAGAATVGPFPVAKPGFYAFELRLGPRSLRWTACLGRCGEHAAAGPFALTRGLPAVDDAGKLWSVTLHFRSTQAAGALVRVYRGKLLARQLRFPIRAGRVTPGTLLLSPGTYRIGLAATDAYGRIRTLTWYAVLP
ncbi:MAG TPA: InlB B-repeat-containing protein [Gaiellaceae bacterium]|jgi:hypothetical protein